MISICIFRRNKSKIEKRKIHLRRLRRSKPRYRKKDSDAILSRDVANLDLRLHWNCCSKMFVGFVWKMNVTESGMATQTQYSSVFALLRLRHRDLLTSLADLTALLRGPRLLESERNHWVVDGREVRNGTPIAIQWRRDAVVAVDPAKLILLSTWVLFSHERVLFF